MVPHAGPLLRDHSAEVTRRSGAAAARKQALPRAHSRLGSPGASPRTKAGRARTAAAMARASADGQRPPQGSACSAGAWRAPAAPSAAPPHLLCPLQLRPELVECAPQLGRGVEQGSGPRGRRGGAQHRLRGARHRCWSGAGDLAPLDHINTRGRGRWVGSMRARRSQQAGAAVSWFRGRWVRCNVNEGRGGRRYHRYRCGLKGSLLATCTRRRARCR